MTAIKLKWNKEEFDITIEPGSTVEVFKTQIWTLTMVPVDRQKLLGFPGGLLKDTDDLGAKVAKLKPGAKIQLVGTAEGGELKAPVEKTVFEEDLSPEEKARILKEKKAEVLPAGIKNLGNTCYMNSCLQCICSVKDLMGDLAGFNPPPGGEADMDTVLTAQLKAVKNMLTNTTEAIVPLQFVMALRQRFPRFAEMQNGAYMQQDADECLRGLFTVLAGTMPSAGGNRIDDIFGFKLQSTLKCLECDEEPPTESEDLTRVLMCHLGTQTEPVSHIHQGVSLSLKEHIEKRSELLGRDAQYEKSSAIASLPPYMVVQFARFGYKSANEWAGTSASKVKLTRKCAFTYHFDVFDCCSDALKRVLTQGRLKKKEQEDAELARQKALLDKNAAAGGKAASSSAPAEGEDVEMQDAQGDVEMPQAGIEEMDTGYYELVGIISHKGRTADGGHYVGWTRHKKADGKEIKDDEWLCFDDEIVTKFPWKDMVGLSTDLQGGKVDTQMAYINIYKKVTVKVDSGNVLGSKEGEEAAAPAAAEPAAEGEAAAAAAPAAAPAAEPPAGS